MDLVDECCIYAGPGRSCSPRLKSVTLGTGEQVTVCSGHAGRVLKPRDRDELERVLTHAFAEARR